MHRGIFFLILAAACATVQAAVICGTVRDTEGSAMPYVTISVLAEDSTLVGGTITAEDGTYSLEAPGTAEMVQASYIGYVTVTRKAGERVDFVMREETTALGEVTVRGRQRIVERKMDRIVMNVAASPFAIGNNGKDILRKAPGVKIDRKGKISVNGKAIEVYIDGRPTYLSGEQLKTMLEGTDGSTIDRVEIITQPSARYDAAGQGGIINIRTRKNMSRGINGSIAASYGGMYWRDMAQYMQEDHVSANLNYRGTRSYTTASLTQQFSDRTERFNSTAATPDEVRETESCSRMGKQYYMLKLNHDGYIDSANTVGFIVTVPVSLNREHGTPERNTSTLTRNGIVEEQNTEERTAGEKWLQHTANINYTHTFDREKEQELTLNMEYNRNNLHAESRTLSRYECAAPYMLDIRTDNRHTTDIWSARLDFETQFWKTGKIECGAKWLTTGTGYHSHTDTTARNPSTASAFRYTEHIAALYATVGKQFGEHWTTKVGLRGEYTRTVGKWEAADSSSVRSYMNLFPTAYVGYMPTEDWSISIDYNRRIERPNYTMLDPAVQVEDAHSIRMGNTELKPAFTHNVQVSFGYSEYVSLDFEFSHTTGCIDYRTEIGEGGDRVSRAMNYGTDTDHGISLSLTEIPIVPKLSAREADGRREVNGAWLALTAQVGALRTHYRSNDGAIDMRNWAVDIYAELSAYLPKEWTVSLDGSYSTPFAWGTERMSEWKELNLALKKDLPRQGLTLTARVNDLLLSSKWGSESLGLPEGYTNTFGGFDRAHMLTLGLTWKFGTSLDHRERHGDSGDTDRAESRGKRRR